VDSVMDGKVLRFLGKNGMQQNVLITSGWKYLPSLLSSSDITNYSLWNWKNLEEMWNGMKWSEFTDSGIS
jgi:hypothetical protein